MAGEMVGEQQAEWYTHSRRIKTEENAKVVPSVLGDDFIQFLFVLAVLHYRTILKNRMNSLPSLLSLSFFYGTHNTQHAEV